MADTIEKLRADRDLQCFFFRPSAIAPLSGAIADGRKKKHCKSRSARSFSIVSAMLHPVVAHAEACCVLYSRIVTVKFRPGKVFAAPGTAVMSRLTCEFASSAGSPNPSTTFDVVAQSAIVSRSEEHTSELQSPYVIS